MFKDEKKQNNRGLNEMVPPNSLNIIVTHRQRHQNIQSDELDSEKPEDRPLNSFFYKKRHEI